MANGSSSHKFSAGLTLAALGIVYGDIGTSPLYAVKETFNHSHGIVMNAQNIIGGISAIFWAIMLVVTLKYITVVMRADNKGEGGIMALLSLAASTVKSSPHAASLILLAGLAGLCLFYGDAVLTPAISILSAVEGLGVGTHALDRFVLPVAAGVIIGLFLIQRHGTAAIGKYFGPIILVWFLSLAAGGIYNIILHPEILAALNPLHAAVFVTQHGFASFVVLGAILLAFTGAEALYADMGHFGKKAIRLAWLSVVFPALSLNYLGQGALLIHAPEAIKNPFYLLFPSWALYPMVGLATAATIIASQATITGTYSLTKQAIQLGFLPRMNVIQTSVREIGQIYMPFVNWTLLIVVLAAVLGFGSSSNLASAYGIAVTGTMVMTSTLLYFVIRHIWGYRAPVAFLASGFFLIIDLAFFSSSLLKVAQGGWFPLVLGAALLIVMLTWRRGRQILFMRLRSTAMPLEEFLKSLPDENITRVPGTAVFLTATPESVPHALLHNLNHNKVLHDRVVILTVEVKDTPRVLFNERVEIQPLGNDFWRIRLNFGFKNKLDVTQTLTELCNTQGIIFDMMQTSFFLSRETVLPVHGKQSAMAYWRELLFATMSKNAGSAVEYFNLPANRVIELGTQIEI